MTDAGQSGHEPAQPTAMEQDAQEQPAQEQSTEEQPIEELLPVKEEPVEELQPIKEEPVEEQPEQVRPVESQPVDVKPVDGNENGDGGEDDEGQDEDDEDEDEDNIKVTIEDYDFKAIQKQAQPTKQAAPLVLETNQEPININQLDEKPWRKPGADINDYFNYGFDETTWRIYCDKQKQMKAIVDEINEPQETFKIPVVHGAPMVQANVMPYIDERLTHVVMDSRNAPPLAQAVGMQQHHQQHHQHQHQHHSAGSMGRMKGVEDDMKKYERRHNRSSERRHGSKSRERRHSKSREREREKEKTKTKDRERKRSRSRERRTKESRPRSKSREDERHSKRQKSRHV